MIDDLLIDAKDRMAKSVESTRGEFATVRTGRATPHLLDRITVVAAIVFAFTTIALVLLLDG